jgi:2-oxoglutarate ferredoxin oxidoreductase subunit beta
MAEMTYKDRLKLDLFPTIWCPGCGIGTIMMQLAMTLDEMRLDERNTVIVTGIGSTRCTAARFPSPRQSRRFAPR